MTRRILTVSGWTVAAPALLLATVLLLTTACGGKESSSSPAAQTGTGSSPGVAEGSVSGASRPAAATSPAANRVAMADTPRPASAAAPRTTGQTRARTGDPCRIVTKEEVEASAGFPLAAGILNPTPIGETCFYADQRSLGGGSVSVTLVKGVMARSVYDSERSQGSAEDVQGVGDQAFVVVGDVQSNILVLDGDVLLEVDLVHSSSRPSDAEVREKLLALAHTALSRL